MSNSQAFPGFAAVPSGAKFHRVDLHIHSYGASSDVMDAGMTPAAVVAKAHDRGIALVALADHNSIANVAALLNAADATAGAVAAIPGVEVTTSQGHVLVYCPRSRLDALARFLVKLDFQTDEQGERYTLSRIDEVARLVADFDGVAIPAHCGRKNTGFLTKAPHRDCQAIFESPKHPWYRARRQQQRRMVHIPRPNHGPSGTQRIPRQARRRASRSAGRNASGAASLL